MQLPPAALAGARVLMVCPLYHPERGGPARQAVLLNRYLAEQGATIHVATRHMTGLDPYPVIPGVHVHPIHAGRPHVHNYEARNLTNLGTSLRFAWGVNRLCERLRGEFDVVHVHGASLPLLATLPWIHWRDKRVIALVLAAHQKVEAGDLAGHYGPLSRVMVRMMRRVDAFVAISSEIEDSLAGEGYAPERLWRIPCGVDRARFRPSSAVARAEARAALGLEDQVALLHAGRLEPRKGADVLIRGLRRVVEEYPDAKPTLLFVGDGPERPRLEALARGLPVRFLGFRDDLERIYGACDVLVLSSYVEGLPNVLLEGMSCGLATVSTALGGACDVIEDGVSGSLVSPGDPESMGAALAELILDPARRDALGAAAADRIAQGFALDVVLPRYVTLYRHLLG